MSGGLNPSPQKFGASAGHIEEILLEALLEADGTALTKEVSSFVYAERFAEARTLAYLWHLNQRMANQWDPLRMTDFLPRWERILGIHPLPTDNEVDRRAKVFAKMSVYGQPATQQVVNDLMTVVLKTLYNGIVNTSSAQAIGRVPGGAIIPGGVHLSDGDWYSTIAHVDIWAVQPAGIDDATFYEAMSTIGSFLDDLLPAWVTWDWFLDGDFGPGFFLDQNKNLDNMRFRV